ncbi:MAG: hypothetical protein JXC85_01955 [Candidatus Aenigmarchaeota archaeon]|nr:hypothetical protein [Candidatus Aenigmarchaeota archaeon]
MVMGWTPKIKRQKQRSKYLSLPFTIALPENHDFDEFLGLTSLEVQYDGRGKPYVSGEMVDGRAGRYLERFFRK